MSNRNVIEYGGGSSRTGTPNGWQHLDFNNSQYSLNDPVLQGDQLNSVQLQLRYGPGNVYLRLYETDNPKHGSFLVSTLNKLLFEKKLSLKSEYKLYAPKSRAIPK